jgi:hypothetical protein
MKTEKKILSGAIVLLMFAYGGCSMAPSLHDEITVSSEPSGASVYVMDKLLGLTPIVVDVDTLYPVTYPQEKQADYGRLTLKHEGCSDQTIKVSIGMVSRGLKAELDCQVAEEPEVEDAPAVVLPVKQRLDELQLLKDDGLINEKEYQEIRSRILDSL